MTVVSSGGKFAVSCPEKYLRFLYHRSDRGQDEVCPRSGFPGRRRREEGLFPPPQRLHPRSRSGAGRPHLLGLMEEVLYDKRTRCLF